MKDKEVKKILLLKVVQPGRGKSGLKAGGLVSRVMSGTLRKNIFSGIEIGGGREREEKGEIGEEGGREREKERHMSHTERHTQTETHREGQRQRQRQRQVDRQRDTHMGIETETEIEIDICDVPFGMAWYTFLVRGQKERWHLRRKNWVYRAVCEVSVCKAQYGTKISQER